MTRKRNAKQGNSTPSGLRIVLRAAAFAAAKHRDQRRKDKGSSPYINHPIGIAEVLTDIGAIRSSIVIAAALLHDTLEDTQTSLVELERNFGPKIAAIVREGTDDKRLPKAKRKALQVEHAAQLSKSAKLVKLADKICNVQDVLWSPPKEWSISRRQDYF